MYLNIEYIYDWRIDQPGMYSVGLCQLGSTRIAVIAKSSKLKLNRLVIGLGGKFHQWFCKWKASPISSIVGWLPTLP